MEKPLGKNVTPGSDHCSLLTSGCESQSSNLTTTHCKNAVPIEHDEERRQNLEANGITRCSFLIVIVSLFFGTFLVALDTTMIGTAIPAITTAFHALGDIGWYGSGYLLTLTAFQPTFGKIFTLFNVKTVYLVCVLVFEAGSILCAAAPSSRAFIAGRTVQGCGAAGILQGALVIITNTVPLEKRPFYLSVVISSFGLCVKIGPLLGGTFTEHASWRWCFWINVPIGAVVMVLIFVFLKLKTEPKHQLTKRGFASATWVQKLKHVDAAGTILVIASICCLLLAVQLGGQKMPWRSTEVVGLFVGSGLMFALFLMIQWRMGSNATLPFAILRQRSILSGALYLLAFAMPTYVYGFYIPIYFQSVKGFSALRSGIDFLALALPQIAFTVLSGWITSKFGYYTPFLIIGTAISVVGSGLLTMLDMHTIVATWVLYFIVIAIGTGISINHPYTAVQAVLDEKDVPIGNAIMQFTFSLGGALSLCVAQSIFVNRLTAQVIRTLPWMPVEKVIAAGAYGLPALAGRSAQTLSLLKEAYRNAIKDVLIYALAAGGMALLFSLGFEHRNVKHVSEEREKNEVDSAENVHGETNIGS